MESAKSAKSAFTTDRDEAVKTYNASLARLSSPSPRGRKRLRSRRCFNSSSKTIIVMTALPFTRGGAAYRPVPQARLWSALPGDSAFTTTALNSYIEGRQKEGRKNATINRELALLRRAFRLGYEHDPQLVRRLPVIKPLKEDNVREGFLDADKYQLILDALNEDIKPIFVVAYHLGMRTGELLALKRSWVDLSEGLIFVNGRVTKNSDPKPLLFMAR